MTNGEGDAHVGHLGTPCVSRVIGTKHSLIALHDPLGRFNEHNTSIKDPVKGTLGSGTEYEYEWTGRPKWKPGDDPHYLPIRLEYKPAKKGKYGIGDTGNLTVVLVTDQGQPTGLTIDPVPVVYVDADENL